MGTSTADRGHTSEAIRTETLAGIPIPERRIELDGIPTAVLTGGDGPPVVLLHGPGEYAALWGRVIPGLLGSHRVIAPDLPGHGTTGIPQDGPLEADRYLQWLDALVAATCDRPPALVGHLAGGAMALRYALDAGPVDRVVLVDSAGLAMNRPAPSFAMPLAGFLVRPTVRSRDRFLGRCMYDFDAMRDDVGPSWDAFADYALDRARIPGGRTAVLALVLAFGLRPVGSRRLATLDVPVSLIWGRQDLQTSLAVAERAARRYGWPLHVIDDCRDDPCWERPEQALAALRSALSASTRTGVRR